MPATKRFFYFISKVTGILPGRDYTALRLVTAQVLADKSVTTKSHQAFTQERQNTNSTAAYE